MSPYQKNSWESLLKSKDPSCHQANAPSWICDWSNPNMGVPVLEQSCKGGPDRKTRNNYKVRSHYPRKPKMTG